MTLKYSFDITLNICTFANLKFLFMYCKHCGKQISDDSTFCQYCGGQQNNIDPVSRETLKVELGGEVKASLTPELPKLTGLKNFCEKNLTLILIYSVWLIINVLLLVNGGDRKGFWPHTYTHRERVAEHTHFEYIPWTEHTVETKSWDLGPEETKISWDVDTYGLSEFLIYVVLIPLLIYIGFQVFRYYKKQGSNPKKTIKFDPSEGLRKF